MTRDDWEGFGRVVGAIYGFYRKELTPINLRIWFEALKVYDVETVRRAFSRHIGNPDIGQFLPMPADLVKLIEGGSDDAALLAWAVTDRALRTIGTYQSVVFDDPLIHYALDNMGGWIQLGTKTEEEWPFVRNQFVSLYRGARMRQGVHYPSHLIGIAEHDGRSQPPIFIGDRVKALEVLRKGLTGPQPEMRKVSELLPALPRKEARA